MEKNNQLNELFKKWKMDRGYDHFISDGIINETLYDEDKEILFIAKEANRKNKSDSDFRDWWNKGMYYTFSRRIGEWAYGLMNDFPSFETITDEIRWNSLRSISFMDVKKTSGKGRSNPNEIYEYVMKDLEYINEQIDIINPKIIISSIGTDCNKVIFGDNWNKTGYWVDYKIIGRKLVIDYYHPSGQSGAPMGYVLLEKVMGIINYDN